MARVDSILLGSAILQPQAVFAHIFDNVIKSIQRKVSQLPYVGKFWRGKILANLVNGWQFTKIFPTNIYKC